MTAPNAALRVLLEALVDYAGLFPPAALDMPAAVRAYAAHRTSDAAWMLGRFIVPATRLDELEGAAAALLPRRGKERPWQVSVLASPDLAEDAERIWTFNERHADPAAGLALVDAIELKAASTGAIEHMLRSVPTGVEAYVEVPIADDPTALIEAIGAVGARAKVRTGGVTPAAFPSASNLARFIRASADAGVPFKATAGLHHPLRGSYRLTYDDGSAAAPMYGFLNIFLAAAFASRSLSLAELEVLLKLSDPAMLAIDERGIGWRDYRVDLDDLRHARARVATSFGSCSFDEPVDDLHTLGLL